VTANRALRFTGAGWADGGGLGSGLVTTVTGAVATIDGDDSVRQAIILLLTTAPGERLLRPEYGSHLNRLTFAPNDRTTAGLAIQYVRSALSRWEPRVDIVRLDADPDPDDPDRLVVSLRYRVRTSLVIDDLELAIATGGPS
jgi:uncharacterized protein